MSLAVAVPDLAGYDNPDDAAPALAGHGVPWSEEECSQLLAGLQNLGNDWSSINKQYVKSRTPKQIRDRYYNCHKLADKEDMERALATYDANNNNSSNSMLECYIRCLTVLIHHAEEDMLGVGPEADEAAAFIGEARDLLNEISAETSVLATQEPVNEI